MKIVGVIPARMKNTRLPGKVLMDLCGMSMLERVVARAHEMKFLDTIVVVFPYGDDNLIIADLCKERKWQHIQGDEDILGNLLSEFYAAALVTNADVIVRIDSDDPFVDPLLAMETFTTLTMGKYDFVSSKAKGSGFPVGVGVEVFTKEALVRAHDMTLVPEQFEEKPTEIKEYLRNVTPFMYKNPGIFKIRNLEAFGESFSFMRLTIDTIHDLRLARMIYTALKKDFLRFGESFNWLDIVTLLERYSTWLDINSHVQQEYVE